MIHFPMLSVLYIYNALNQDSIDLDPLIIAKAMMDAKDGKPLMLMMNIAEDFSWRIQQKQTGSGSKAS